MTSSFSKELEKQWNSLTLRKFVICCIIILCFIMFLKVVYKDNVLESFTGTRTLDDLALVKFEFAKYNDDFSSTSGHSATGETIDQRIVWDNRIYMLQPAKQGERRYSFWNINNDTGFTYNSSRRPIKSIGTSINVASNEAPPSKPVPVVTAGRFRPIDRYEEVKKIGSDEFSDLQLNYNTIRETNMEKLLKLQTNIKTRLRALKKLKDYYTNVTQADNLFIQQQLDKFVLQIMTQYKVTPIGFDNPRGKVGWDTFNLASVNKTNGMRSMTDLSKGGVGEIVAFEGVPFGAILTLSQTAALASPVVFREPYETNAVYKEKLLKVITGPLDQTVATGCPTLKEVLSVRKNQRAIQFGSTGTCVTTTSAATLDLFDFTTIRPTNWTSKNATEIKAAIANHPVDTVSKQFHMWLNEYAKNIKINQLYTKLYGPPDTNTFATQNKMFKSYFSYRRDTRTSKIKSDGRKAHELASDFSLNGSKAEILSSDKNNMLSPESFYFNMVSENMIYEVKVTTTYTSGIAGSKQDTHTVRRPVKSTGIQDYDSTTTSSYINRTLRTNLLSVTAPVMSRNIATNIMGDTGLLRESKIRDLSTYKNRGDANKGNLKLSHVSFKHFKTKPDEKVKIFNSDVYNKLGQTDYNILKETSTTEQENVAEINTYLKGHSMYDFNTAFTNFSTPTLNNVTKELHYTQFNYNLQITMSGDSRIPKVNSWSFDLNSLDAKIRDQLKSDIDKFRTYYFTSPESSLQTEINVRMASINKNITMLDKLDKLITKINTNQIPFPSLRVIRPIPPKGFKVLGDIILTSAKGILQRATPFTRDAITANVSTILATAPQTAVARYQSDHRDGVLHEKDYIDFQLQKYVAVPESCVKTVREWRDTDKVFEIVEGGATLQIYNNPYTNTITVTTNKLKPPGNVEKMIACVKECDVISELKKTDDCAKKLYKTKKALEGGSSVTSNLANAEENKYYLNKIQSRSQHIKNLSNAARDLQMQQDKYEIINSEKNRSKLQRYVDEQGRNIAIIRDKLEKGKNTIDLNTYIHPDGGSSMVSTGSDTSSVGSRQETTNMINKLIGQSSLSTDTKNNLLSKVNNYKRQLDNELISPDEYNSRVNNALQSCPEYDLNGLIHKDTVSDVCYGCNL